MIETDLIGTIVKYPTELVDYQPTKHGYGVVRGALARRVKDATWPSLLVQTLDHVVGTVDDPKLLTSARLQQLGGRLVACDLSHCSVCSWETVMKVFAARTA